MIEYDKIYSRNIGLFTEAEQRRLKNAVVAVAGVGGVGSYQAVALARQGVGELRIMDPGIFDEPDLNRQYGAMMSTLGKNKAAATAEILKDINPHMKIKTYTKAAETIAEIEEFIKGADAVIDAIDYAGFNHKQLLHERARANGQYVFSSPIPGFGASLMIFSPSGMTMEDYYGAPADPALYKNFKLSMEKLMPAGILPQFYRDFESGRIGYLSTNGASAQLSGAITGLEIALIITGKRKKEDLVVVPDIIYLDLFNRNYSIFNPCK
ncbi:MAG: putative adenylyltransferase/sulfurtransferase MoeZ [bacterium ADurb.Bin243]|nr:MAG: putative adenylyltransferase/sulfurtransferase MoeZ [bacterium ADurb.Bin243]HOD41440.1 ThiF family adenylyltransferase [Candidatus Wallbacteria bacterium]